VELTWVAGGSEPCDDMRNCPTISLAADGTLVVSGPAVAGVVVSAGEEAVSIPAAVLLAAADRLRGEGMA
jgi:hypothetical protein